MKAFLRFRSALLLSAAVVTGAPGVASAQAGAVVPVPFVTSIAGIAPGSSSAFCTTGIPNQNGIASNGTTQNLGDGCIPTAAYVASLNDVEVDSYGNVYIAENGSNPNAAITGGSNVDDIRMIYFGGAAATAMLKGANAGIPNFTPIPGHIYTLAGGLLSALVAVQKVDYCSNQTTNHVALDTEGNGCPATQAYIRPIGMAVDQYGNVFTTNNGGASNLRVIYAGGAQVAALITLVNPSVTTPQVGYIYHLTAGTANGYQGDGTLNAQFGSIRYLAIDPKGNIFISDGATPTLPTGSTTQIDVSAVNVRRFDGTTGIVTTVAGNTSATCSASQSTTSAAYPTGGCPFGPYPGTPTYPPPAGYTAVPVTGPLVGDGGPATQALFDTPWTIFTDSSGNLYIADRVNARLRVVYYGGTIAGISNPVIGNIYTYAGGGTLTTSGSPANQVKFGQIISVGIDRSGNIYVIDSSNAHIWKFDAITGIGNIIGGPLGTVAAAGAFCVGTSGPVSTDTLGDGCPAARATISGLGTIAFDPQGNFYLADNNKVIRKFYYNNQFAATPDGTPVTQPLAFEAIQAVTPVSESFTLQGGTSTDFSDGGSDGCTLNTALAVGAVCIDNVTFNPAHDGQRSGSVQLASTAGGVVAEALTGTGVGADMAIDTGTVSMLGSGITPNGIASDQLGNVYVSDSKGNQVLKGASSGTSLTPLVTGLKQPSAIAVDGMGNVYIADTGNNRVLETTSTGTTIASLGIGLTAPAGVAVDGFGNIFVSDTGNNRIVQISSENYQRPVPITGLSAPTQLTFDTSGNLYVLDAGNKRVIEYSAANGQTVLAFDNGVVPAGFALDPSGTYYVADMTSLTVLSYPAGALPGNVLLSGLTTPIALAADEDANLFVADAANASATELRRTLGNFSFPITNLGTTTTQSITVNNVGNSSLNFTGTPLTSLTGSPLFSVVPAASNGCASATPYVPGAACNLTASFSPAIAGTYKASVLFNTNGADAASATAALSAIGAKLAPTTTALVATSATGGTVFYGQTTTLTATLTPSAVTVTPTGTYTFTIDGRTQAPIALTNGSTAKLTLTLPVGPHVVSVTYSGDINYASSSNSVNFPVDQAVTTTALVVTPLSTNGVLSLQFTATVASPTATGETGTVTFYGGTQVLGTATVAGGVASFNSTVLTFANNTITAVYGGNSNFAGSTSAAIASTTDFAVGSPALTMSVSQGGVGTATTTIASYLGSGGTITPSCTGLPANSVCRFLPVTIGLTSGTTQTVQISVFTNVSSTLASNEGFGMPGLGVFLACVLPLGAACFWRRRRTPWQGLILAVSLLGLIVGLSGCQTSFCQRTPDSSPRLVTRLSP